MKRQKGFSLIELLITLAVVVIIVIVCFTHFGGATKTTQETQVQEHLQAEGYDRVKIVDSSYFTSIKGCSEDDNRAFLVEAINAQGKRVSCVVCMGLIKKPTTRGARILKEGEIPTW